MNKGVIMSKGDFKICLEEANEFLEVAEWCNNSTRISSIYSSVVNASFSCELYIKALMIYKSSNNEFSIGHNIENLFNLLEVSDKTAIENLYLKKTNKSLSKLLIEIDDAFVKWRYAFENGVSINITECLLFAETLKKYVMDNCK